MTTDKEHLQWIHDRIVEVYGESENVDFLIRMRQIIDKQDTELNLHSVMRYFFITFNGDGVGAIWFNADGFPSHKQMLTAIKTKYPEMKNPVITGIKELSEKDYNDLCA